jgi:hypothetical protein
MGMRVKNRYLCPSCKNVIEVDAGLNIACGGQAKVLMNALRTYLAFCPDGDMEYLFELLEVARAVGPSYRSR